jgi:hypothetical protein
MTDDVYPTDEELRLISNWSVKDITEWFAFVQSLWALTDWKIEDVVDDILERPVTRYTISTGGWSGNEELIGAMQRNWLLWSLTWVQSRRGGQYIFEDPRYYDNMKNELGGAK